MSDEKYVTLTEALEWEKRVRAQMSEDEKVRALEWAKEEAKYRETVSSGLAADALLEAARLIRTQEWVWMNDEAPTWAHWECAQYECFANAGNGNEPNPTNPDANHAPECTVGRWVRAAERAGI